MNPRNDDKGDKDERETKKHLNTSPYPELITNLSLDSNYNDALADIEDKDLCLAIDEET